MLPETDRLLLTAYLDGELSSRQYRQVLKLLRRSGEARTLLRQLQELARTLRQLPKTRLPQDLSASVLQLIRERRVQPRPRPVHAPKGAFPVWAGYAAAAAVLFVVCAGSYLFFSNAFNTPQTPAVAQQGQESQPQQSEPTPHVDPLVKGVQEPEQLPVMPKRNSDDVPPIVQVSPLPLMTPLDPEPDLEKPREPNLLTAPATEMVELKMVDIAAPVIVKLQEIEHASAKAALLADLHKANGFRIEFPCRNGTRGFERFLAACKAQDIALHIDQTAAERLKHPPFKSSYALYVEDVTPEELTRLFQQVAAEDKKPEGKKSVEGQFDRFVMVWLNRRDRKELQDLLGSDPTAAATELPGVDVHKALAEQTASRLAAALAGQGGAPSRPNGGQPAAKAPERTALVIPYAPFHPAANSAEIKRYFETRKPPRPGTLQVFLIVRETGA